MQKTSQDKRTPDLVEPPSNAPVATKTKYKKGEVKAKIIIIDFI